MQELVKSLRGLIPSDIGQLLPSSDTPLSPVGADFIQKETDKPTGFQSQSTNKPTSDSY